MEIISFKSLFSKFTAKSCVKIYLPGVLLFAILIGCNSFYNIPIGTYTRDVIQTFGGKPYVGLVSNIGILLWAATVGILFFSAKIALIQHKPKLMINFYLFSGSLSLLLLIDDAFLLHDVIFPEYLLLDEKLFFVIYGVSVLTFMAIFRKIILKTDYILYLLAFGLFIGSAGVDLFVEYIFPFKGEYLVEDGLKFFGICSWFAYFLRASYLLLEFSKEEFINKKVVI